MPPILTPTLEAEIAAKRAEIAANQHHSSRTSYVASVSPLKQQLQSLVEQNKTIIAANAILTTEYIPILTPEELDKDLNAKIAADVAIDYPLPDQMALNWKVQTGELTMESPEIVAFIARVDEVNAKY